MQASNKKQHSGNFNRENSENNDVNGHTVLRSDQFAKSITIKLSSGKPQSIAYDQNSEMFAILKKKVKLYSGKGPYVQMERVLSFHDINMRCVLNFKLQTDTSDFIKIIAFRFKPKFQILLYIHI